MHEIAGVFNYEPKKSAERVVKGLEVLKTREAAGFWMSTGNGGWYSKDMQELKQSVKMKRDSNNCIASSSCFKESSSGKSTFVADAEIYSLHFQKEQFVKEASLADRSFLKSVDGIGISYCGFILSDW